MVEGRRTGPGSFPSNPPRSSSSKCSRRSTASTHFTRLTALRTLSRWARPCLPRILETLEVELDGLAQVALHDPRLLGDAVQGSRGELVAHGARHGHEARLRGMLILMMPSAGSRQVPPVRAHQPGTPLPPS